MTAEIEYLLARLETVADNQPEEHPLRIGNRDESFDATANQRAPDRELQRGNWASVGFMDSSSAVRGNEYNLDTEVVCTVRIEGVHWLENGHIDPDGEQGRQWSDSFDGEGNRETRGLTTEIRDRILADRTYPDAPGPDAYRHLLVDDDPQAPDFGDYYRHDITVTFVKAEEP